jgi:hypothetical protein
MLLANTGGGCVKIVLEATKPRAKSQKGSEDKRPIASDREAIERDSGPDAPVSLKKPKENEPSHPLNCPQPPATHLPSNFFYDIKKIIYFVNDVSQF